MKRIKFLVPLLAVMMFSCDDYLDINESPNNPQYEDVTPKLLLPGAQVSSARVQIITANQLGNVFMNSWTRNVQSFGNGFDRELQLNIDNTFYSGIWDGYFRALKNFDGVIKYPNASGKYDYYVAIAKICKAHYMQQIVDLYGDCPYTEAWQGNDNITPAYDDDYAIYQDLIANLEQARDLIANANPDPNVTEEVATDVMLGGDMDRWVEFANTIELRMLLRMSNVTGAPATYRDTKLAEIAAGPFLSDNVAINPGYNSSTDASANPAFNNFAIDVTGTARSNRTFITMTGHAYKALQSYATTNYPAAGSQEIVAGSGVNYPNVTDPRSARLFTAAPSNARRAVNQGSSLVDVGAPTTTFPGLPCRLGLIGHFNPYAMAPNQTIDEYSAIDSYVMTYSESCFLQAEAAVRYPALFSNEQFWFDEGIYEDFAMRVATVGTYVTTINTRPWFGLAASTTFDQKIHAIMYQKWVALMGINAIQSYIDYTRTGYPLTPLASVAIQSRKPYRLVYPVSEYVANSANVPAMTANDAFVVNSLSPFWLQ
ncbi:SusD/RagB family nutrient-binding outer membrane lipoprotein [Flavobacterium proteolyticum]|uniref:SusD/RagB family nutrient-binding outer membrane lipoprotein n=1 Tax=Flavobacterium proteolyticum TaxID=2911683 RepID=A0ABR9WNU9_9FLAO|nr:SusD/RagB family nutrient-binding outer membrane lipoprotein [Flavobacterium proteolyticum]MBE9575174.1 SusD/RagB family nutrient-binding outer membrane lipoprotein [Flavobacterium proteolyticum]